VTSPEQVPDDASEASSGLVSQIADRRNKRQAILDAGLEAYPMRFEGTESLAEVRRAYGDLDPDQRTGKTVRVAGRVVSVRGHGKLVFVSLRDATDTIQIMCQANRLSSPASLTLQQIDLGDWIGAEGEVITSRRGELSIDAVEITLLSKALRPPPDKWHGLTESEMRYRQREVDLLANEDSRRVFKIRSALVSSLRQSLTDRGFIEVETPVLQPQAGGALARPFFTHANALDIDLSLRIAPELYLKRLVVGGFERVFEIGRNFRNEGIDTRHSPEFTSVEAYQAFGDYHDGMDLTEALIVEAAKNAAGRLTFAMGDQNVDLTPPWPRRMLLDLLKEHLGVELHPTMPREEIEKICEEHEVPVSPSWGSGKLIFELYDKLLMPGTVGPIFVCGYPVEVSPLARHSPDDPTLVDRFELVIGGRELANGYSELNDPDEQEERFRAEAAAAASGDLESHPADRAFVRALEYGLPPTAGIGIGIDRLVMLVAEVSSIRDVILFPMLRPEAKE
jgi:lysyl-tRNA synthetase, class II